MKKSILEGLKLKKKIEPLYDVAALFTGTYSKEVEI